jgi:hypothetical protein
MKHRPIGCCALILTLLISLGPAVLGQAGPQGETSSFRPGLEFEYGSRTVGWTEDGEELTSKMSFWFAGLVLEYEIQPGFLLTGRAGYSSTSFDSLIFRRLPLSVELDSGGIGGIVLGIDVEKSLSDAQTYSIDIAGQFLAALGLNKKWEIPGLAVDGSVQGKPTWMRASLGPVLSYRGWEGVTPFLYPRLDYIWGKLKLEETIQELKGSEQKDLKGKALFGVGLGADFDLSTRFRLRAEAALYPREGGTDFSFLVRTVFGL